MYIITFGSFIKLALINPVNLVVLGMKSFFERHRNILLNLALCIFLLCTSMVLLDYDIESSGASFLFLFVVTLMYLPIAHKLRSYPKVQANTLWKFRNPIVYCIISLLLFLAMMEVFPKHDSINIIIWFSTAVTIFSYFLVENDHIKKLARGMIILTFLILILLNINFEDQDDYAETTLLFVVNFIFVGLYWGFKQFKSILQLKKEKKATELLHLQSQVNPHFFFNTLNNLYGLIDIDKKKAQALILKLSDMMRYSIYDGQKKTVPLVQEVNYLKDYIELHKIRYKRKIDVSFEENISSENTETTPLLFIILLENAFKHGVEKLRENAFVNIQLSSDDKNIHFLVENNFDEQISSNDGGIGLQNLKRRLELVYPNKHKLSLSKTENLYRAELNLSI